MHIQEVESLLADETTRHRHELMTLQEMHDHQVAELQSKYNIEVTKLRQQPDTDCSSDTAREGKEGEVVGGLTDRSDL